MSEPKYERVFSFSLRLVPTQVFLDNNSMNLLLNSTHGHAPSDLAVYLNSLYYWGINTQSYCDYSFIQWPHKIPRPMFATTPHMIYWIIFHNKYAMLFSKRFL